MSSPVEKRCTRCGVEIEAARNVKYCARCRAQAHKETAARARAKVRERRGFQSGVQPKPERQPNHCQKCGEDITHKGPRAKYCDRACFGRRAQNETGAEQRKRRDRTTPRVGRSERPQVKPLARDERRAEIRLSLEERLWLREREVMRHHIRSRASSAV